MQRVSSRANERERERGGAREGEEGREIGTPSTKQEINMYHECLQKCNTEAGEM
jgi:hypothetical protein